MYAYFILYNQKIKIFCNISVNFDDNFPEILHNKYDVDDLIEEITNIKGNNYKKVCILNKIVICTSILS